MIDKAMIQERMESLFKISTVKVKTGNAEIVSVEHRLGRDGGYFTRDDLMNRLGFREEITDFEEAASKKVSSAKDLRTMVYRQWSVLGTRMKHAVRDYRKHLESVYGDGVARPRFPMFAFVPVNEKEEGLYFQGIFDTTEKRLVAGRVEDAVLWVEAVCGKSKKLMELFRDWEEGTQDKQAS